MLGTARLGAPAEGAPSSGSVRAWLSELAALVERAGDLDVAAVEASEAATVHDALRRAGDQLGALRARLVTHIAADGRWAASGSARTLPDWVAGQGGMSVGAARREVALGQLLESDAPAVGDAVGRGEISLEHAEVISRRAATSEARRVALASDLPDRNEAHLVEMARRLSVDQFDRYARRWAAAVDTATHEAESAAAVDRQYVRLSPRDGGVDLKGFLAPEGAELLRTALRSVSGVPAADDARTPERRRADALTDLARILLDNGLAGAGKALVRPHLLVHVPFETYAALAADRPADDGEGPVALAPPVPALTKADGTLGAPAELDDGTPLAMSALARLACDALLTRVVMDPLGQPLDVGRAQRTFTGPQRAAVLARDKQCRYPGCGAPPAICEVHHIVWWSRLGETSVSNGILLCAYHHHLVHRKEIAITREGGGFRFARADGRPVAPERGHDGGGASPPPDVRARGESPDRAGAVTSRAAGATDAGDSPGRAGGAAARADMSGRRDGGGSGSGAALFTLGGEGEGRGDGDGGRAPGGRPAQAEGTDPRGGRLRRGAA